MNLFQEKIQILKKEFVKMKNLFYCHAVLRDCFFADKSTKINQRK